MIRHLMLASVATFSLGSAALSQTATTTGAPVTPDAAVAAATPAAAAVDLGVQPLADVPAANYVAWAWDGNNYEIEAARVAVARASRPDVKAYAQSMLTAHEAMLKSLQGSLKNASREFVAPAAKLSPENAGLIKQLETAPKASFDNLYLTQAVAAHQKAWSLNKGFATSGQDEALKAIATTNVPMIEQHYAEAKGLTPSNLAAK